MARIKNLHINNFKFFSIEEPLDLENGKHLLVYGENGSGKSTIYWALYTLLEAATKTDINQVQKYFRRGTSERDSLVNIYAIQNSTSDFDSFVEAELDNGTRYKISLNDTALMNSTSAKMSNRVSDFMNYRLLYKAYDFAHSDEIDLYPLFHREVLPYVDFTPTEFGLDAQGQMQYETRALSILTRLFKEGPGYVNNAKGSQILAPQHTPQYKQFEGKLNTFNSDLRSLLTHINVKGNEILKENLGYNNFEFNLSLNKNAAIDKKDKWFAVIYPQISLSIPTFNGIPNLVHKPHSFLNEARLSAIAIAIRLAILERNYDATAELRLLVLDDLLMSLDMQNRDRVLELLLAKYASRYQIVLLTHDYHFFEIAKKRIHASGQKTDWLSWEVYANQPNGGFPRPCIIKSESYLEKAKKYLNTDFEIAGNYLRKEAERWLKSFLPRRLQLTKEFAEKDLNGMIRQAIEFAKNNGLTADSQELLKRLDEHRKFIFNPLSHDNFDVSQFRVDVQRAVETLEKLNKISSRTICKIGDVLWFELKMNNSDVLRFDIEFCDEFKILYEPNTTQKLAFTPFFARFLKNGKKVSGLDERKDLKKFYDYYYDDSDKSTNSDFTEGVLLENGQPLRSKM